MWVNRYATLLAFCTFLLLISGGLVSVMEAGMACGFDWPLCQGEYFPQLIDGKQYEHPHRLTAMLVGALTFGLSALLFKYRRADRKLVGLGIAAVLLVIVQALLGRLTVKMALPAWVSSLHQATAMAFFSLVVSIAFLVSQRSSRGSVLPEASERPERNPGRFVVLAIILLTYAQVIAGAVMRHTRGGLACGFEFPLCWGELWPSGHVALHAHMVHRVLGISVAIATLVFAVRIRAYRLRSRIGRVSAALAVAAVIQIALGVLTIFTSRDIAVMTLHSALGAAILAGWVSMYWLSYPSPSSEFASTRAIRAGTASLEPA